MKGLDHFLESQRLLATTQNTDGDVMSNVDATLAAAQVHATLALAVATIYSVFRTYKTAEDWEQFV